MNLTDTESYVSAIKSGDGEILSDCDTPKSEKFYYLSLLLRSSAPHRALKRRKIIKQMITSLTGEGYLNGCKVKFNLSRREPAYMYDDGRVYFSYYYLHGSAGGFLAKMVLHEIAHLYLAQKSDYVNLCALNKDFLKNVKGADNLSPIEYAATVLSVKYMETANEKRSRLHPDGEGFDIQIAEEKQSLKRSLEALI